MGFFTSTEDTYNDIYIENAHRYEDEYGINLITLEAVQFGQEVFGDMVRYDIQECTTGVVQEGVVQDIWEKVKAFFKKAWNKIKLFFKGLYAKILARMTSDNKAFYDKYHKDVDANADALSMEVKYRDVKDLPDIGKLDTTKFTKFFYLLYISNLDNSNSDEDNRDSAFSEIIRLTTSYNSKASKITNFSDFKNELKEATIGDENEVKFSFIKSDIEEILKSGNKNVKDAQKAESDALKKVKEYEKALKDDTTAYRTNFITAKNTDRSYGKNTAIGPIKAASFLITIITTMTSAIVDIIKFRNSQARKIYARAVSYKESYDYDYELAFTEADSLV